MPVLAVRGGAGGPGAKSVRLSRPPGALLFEHQLGRGFWMGIGGPVGPTGHRGREAIAPWSLPWKTGEARLARPSSLPLTGPSRLLPSLARQDARRDPRKAGVATRASGFPRAGEQVPLNSCSSWAPASHAELDVKAGAGHGHGGTERAGPGSAARGRAGGG